MVYLAHFSDVHLTTHRLGWKRRDVLSKKLTGWFNVKVLGRGRRFRHAARITSILHNDLKTRGYDHLIFSGDATKLAFDAEMTVAAERLGVNDPALPPAIAVPGNHDYYVAHDFLAGRFEQHFAPWQTGQRIGTDPYPFAKRIGHVWLLAVNSAQANFWTWDARGRIGREQLDRLRILCAGLSPGPRIVVTHYPLRKADGRLELPTRRLRDHRAALEAANECGISLWLHGHIHRGFVLEPGPEIPFPIICSGSATQTHRWSYNDYRIDGRTLAMTRRVFDPHLHRFTDHETRTLRLPGG
jgi:3',5'-cyclic AMP phosphodiesterase CpdA